jgi:predicted DNA-binding transcriptional regulator YafY
MTAQAQLARILHLVPLAAREGGASYHELARALGIDREQVLRDLEAVTAREFYHPAGTGADIQVGLDGDRVRVWTTGPLRRPVRLDLREAAALHLGLRLLGTERDDPGLPDAMRRVEERIAWALPDDLDGAVAGGAGSNDALRATVMDAARGCRRVRIDYLKPDAPDVETRVVDPYVVAYAQGHWYVVGHDHSREDTRVFRVDRVLEARPLDERFDPPDDFDPTDFLAAGRVYRADDEIEVTVRYSPRVARWITERGEGEAREDGSVVITHAVADPGWIVRHVLQYGPDAEVIAPREARQWVKDGLAQTSTDRKSSTGVTARTRSG